MNFARVVVLLCLAAPAYAEDAQVAAGAELYAENCARCHGDEAEGLQGYAGTLETLTARLDGITEGMPDFAGWFEPDEVAALQAFLADMAGEG